MKLKEFLWAADHHVAMAVKKLETFCQADSTPPTAINELIGALPDLGEVRCKILEAQRALSKFEEHAAAVNALPSLTTPEQQ